MSGTMIRYPRKAWFNKEDAQKCLLTRDYVYLGRQGDKTLLGYWQVKINFNEGEMKCEQAEVEIIERELD